MTNKTIELFNSINPTQSLHLEFMNNKCANGMAFVYDNSHFVIYFTNDEINEMGGETNAINRFLSNHSNLSLKIA